jgi:hypothetical protein
MATSPSARRIVAALVAAAVVFGSLAILIVATPTSPTAPLVGTIVVDNRTYYSQNVTVAEPGWSNFTFRGVAFDLHAWCSPVTPGGVAVCGNASPLNGVAYAFSFWIGLGPSCAALTWVAPTGQMGVELERCPVSGPNALLLVAP